MGTKNKKHKKAKEKSNNEVNINNPTSAGSGGEISAIENNQVDMNDSISTQVEQKVLIEHQGVPEVTTQPQQGEEKQKKSHRKRKKHYFNAIRGQMEFYFGDANLSKDRFLKQLVDKDPYVPLDIFLTFNKMKALTSSVLDIATSLSNSLLLELDDSQQKVRRKTALPTDRNVDEKTLYVEALPPSADHEWVKQIFERFGKVNYISLPKYAKSRKIKEFGFVEFEKEESINKAVKAFLEFNGVLKMQEKDPAELVSVKSYIKEQAGETVEAAHSAAVEEIATAKKHTVKTNDEDEPKAKKVKSELQDESDAEKSSKPKEEITSQSETESTKLEPGDTEEVISAKKKRRKQKKTKSAEKIKRDAELNTDVAYYEMKILPKKDWKRLRNKYLNLQREKVAELKRKAWREQQEIKLQQQKDENTDDGGGSAQKIKQEPNKKSEKSTKHKLQKMNMNFYGAAEEEQNVLAKTATSEKPPTNAALEKPPLFSYEPGLIVQVTFLEPCVNVKEFKADMRQYASVKYVDIKEGALQSFLRLESAEKAVEFVQTVSCAEYQCKILLGAEEEEYWQKIHSDREQKLNKQVKIPQKRGRERVKKLLTKHIRFGDDDEE